MSDATAVKPAKAATSTADDTLKEKSRDVNVISGGHLVAKALKAEGVDTIFTLCGGHIIDIYDGCIDEGIRIVDVRHEQTAAHAADGYARQTGKLGCVVTTERVADMITMAARECFNGAYGPCYLEIPRDVLDREVDITKAVLPQPG